MTCSLSTFLLWVRKREEVPDNDDPVYVAGYDYKLSKRETIKILRCFLTTKRLIKQATRRYIKKIKNIFSFSLSVYVCLN